MGAPDLRKRVAAARRKNALRIEELEQREVPATTLSFDFGPATAPVAPGYTGASVIAYSTSNHFGWQSTTGLTATVRTASNPLSADFISGGNGTFLADVDNGTYDIVATLGDAAAVRDRVSVWAQGVLLASNVTTQAGQFVQVRGRVTVTNGRLSLHVLDNNGANPGFCRSMR